MITFLSRITVVALLVFLSGCATSRYLPDEDLARGEAPIPVAVSPGEISNDFIQDGFNQSPSQFGASKRQMVSTTVSDWGAPPEPLTPEVMIDVETSREQINMMSTALTAIPYVLTLGIVPGVRHHEYETRLTMKKNGQELYQHSNKGILRRYNASFLIPFLGVSDDRAASEMMHDVLADHRTRLSSFIAAHKDSYEHHVPGQPADKVRQWLRDNPDALYRRMALARLVEMAPAEEHAALQWHQRHLQEFPGYQAHLAEADHFWFQGPEGETVLDLLQRVNDGANVEILAARIRSRGGPYKHFSREEERRLLDAGMPATLVAAMMEASGRSSATPHSTVDPASAEGRHVSDLVRHDNTGQYMSPWTSDGVLAEWVNMAIDAQIGEAAGGAVGAVAGAAAGRRALRNAPGGGLLGGLVGGAAGSQAGKTVGRDIAIEAAGGMDHVRDTSDMSFDSLEDMARYLRAMHGNDPNFADAINAASHIYPGLKDAL